MKRKIFLGVLMVMALVCLMAVTAFAAEPNSNGETVTLGDGTVLPIWDTDGDALIWYKSSANTNDGYASYDYIKAQASEVSYVTSWAGGINGAYANQVGTVTINVNGASYGKNDIVVFNIKDEDVLVTSTNHGRQGQSVNCVAGVFQYSTSIEYVYLRLDTVAIQGSAFPGATKLKYVNIEELTELNQIVSQNFSGCTSLFEGVTLDLSKTKITTLNSGTFNNTPIGGLIFPETLTALGSWSLQGLTKIKEIHIPETVTSFGDTMFKNCYELETITGYKSLFERGVISKIQGATFLDCKALKSVDLPDTYTAIDGFAFKGTASLTGTFKLPKECTSIGEQVFHGTGFETIILNNNITVIPIYAFCQSYVKYVYIPAGVTEIGREAFRDVKNKMVVYYTGNDADVLKSITVNNYNGVILDKTTIYVSADEFDLENRETQHYVVYGYDNCEAFFGGHKMSENTEMKFTSYFEAIKFASVCTNEGCDHAGYDESKTIGAIFVDYGYSMTEGEIGGKLSMSQFFGIDKTNLEKYTTLTGNAFEYGFVVSSNADPMNEANSGLIAEGKTYITTQNGFKHDYFAVAVAGFTDATVDNALTFCVYVKDGAKVSYLDNGETVETVNMKSYNQIKALLGK